MKKRQHSHPRGKLNVKQNKNDMRQMSKCVNISELKNFVIKNFPLESPLKRVLVNEEDVLSAQDFLAKLSIWLKLSSY
jgi:hypothetical protein